MARANPAIPSSVNDNKVSAGDPIPPKCSVIEVHVGELKQLFNSIDPSPFRNRDLDREAEEFIVGWAKDLPRDVALAWLSILTAMLVYRMRQPFCAMRSTSFLGNAQKVTGGDYANCFAAAGLAS